MVVLPAPKFLGPSGTAPRTVEFTNTAFYVCMSVATASDASEAIRLYGIKGRAEAWRVSVVAFCVGSWLGIYRADIPLIVREPRRPEPFSEPDVQK